MEEEEEVWRLTGEREEGEERRRKMKGQVKGILKIESRNSRVGEHATRGERLLFALISYSVGTTLLLPIYYSQLPSRLSRFAFAFHRFMDSRGIENRVCYKFVVVHGRVRNYQASELRSACQPPPPIYLRREGSPLPGQVYFQIASGEKRGGGGKQKRRNREYLHSPTPFPLPIISLL